MKTKALIVQKEAMMENAKADPVLLKPPSDDSDRERDRTFD